MAYHVEIKILDDNALDYTEAFTRIPAYTTELKLSLIGGNISNITGAELKVAFAAIPDSVTSLDLSDNDLWRKTGADLAEAFAGIPKTVTSLDLTGNHLGYKRGVQLNEAFAGIPDTVTSLDLSNNDLWGKRGSHLKEIFTAIPASVTSLNLSYNSLGEKTAADLALAFAGIPDTVTSLDLVRNDLWRKTSAGLAEAFAGIPANVTTLNLSFNGLEGKTPTDLAEALACIPETVTSVKLGWTNRKWAKNAIVKLSKHIKSENGKDDVEKILRVLDLDELKALHSIYFRELKNLMTTSRGMHNPLSDMVSTSKKGISGLTGNFPEEMMHSVFPRVLTQFLYDGPDLGEILKKCYDDRMRVETPNRVMALYHQLS
jgi:hypothetical protein